MAPAAVGTRRDLGPPTQANRTSASGGFDSLAKDCRSALRNYAESTFVDYGVGFRLAKTVG